MSIGTDEADGVGRRRAALLADLHDLIDAFAVMDEAGLPDGPLTFQARVPDGLDHGQKLAWLDRKAAAWGVPVIHTALGRHAEKRCRSVRFVASVAHPGRGVFEYKDRARAHALRSSIASNGLGATA